MAGTSYGLVAGDLSALETARVDHNYGVDGSSLVWEDFKKWQELFQSSFFLELRSDREFQC